MAAAAQPLPDTAPLCPACYLQLCEPSLEAWLPADPSRRPLCLEGEPCITLKPALQLPFSCSPPPLGNAEPQTNFGAAQQNSASGGRLFFFFPNYFLWERGSSEAGDALQRSVPWVICTAAPLPNRSPPEWAQGGVTAPGVTMPGCPAAPPAQDLEIQLWCAPAKCQPWSAASLTGNPGLEDSEMNSGS